MAKSGYIVGVILMITLTITTVNATLKCWRCNTDTSNSDFCRDPFDQNPIDRFHENARLYSLVNCSNPHNYLDYNMPQKRPVCKKLVQEVYGKTIISRSCVWVDINDPVDKCYYDSSDAGHVKIKFCETCSTDGCNGANGIMPIVSVILIPAVIAKILMI